MLIGDKCLTDIVFLANHAKRLKNMTNLDS
jgi:hypothetical protein